MADFPPVIMFLAKAFQSDTPRPRKEAKTLTEAGYPVYVIAWDRECGFDPVEEMDGALVRSFHLVNLRRFSKLGLVFGALAFEVLLIFETLKLMQRSGKRPIVHAHDFNTLLPGCFLRILGLSSGLVYDCRELSFAVYSKWFNGAVGGLVRAIEERCLPYADTVIAPTDPIADYLRRFNRATVTIYTCMETSEVPTLSKAQLRAELGLSMNAFIVSYVGEINYLCRLDLLLSVASVLRNEDLQFVVVGAGPLAHDFRLAAEQLPDSRLTIVPHVPWKRALMYVSASDLTWAVYDSREGPLREQVRLGLPVKLFESLACSVPVVVEGNNIRAKLVAEQECGIVLETDAPNHASKAILELAKDQAVHRKMALAARNASQTLGFSWERMSSRLLGIYERLRQTPLRFEEP